MFCANCGKEVSETSSFCQSCGAKIGSANKMATQGLQEVKASSKKGKIIIGCIVAGVIGIIIILSTGGSIGGNSLNGTWEFREGEHYTEMVFSGKNFTIKSGSRRQENGTYSIKNDKIEVTIGGKTEIINFSRIDKNTIVIGILRLTRK